VKLVSAAHFSFPLQQSCWQRSSQIGEILVATVPEDQGRRKRGADDQPLPDDRTSGGEKQFPIRCFGD